MRARGLGPPGQPAGRGGRLPANSPTQAAPGAVPPAARGRGHARWDVVGVQGESREVRGACKLPAN